MGALIGAGTITKAGTYTATSADRGKIIECTGSWTLSLPDAAAVSDGFALVIANTGSGAITLDPYASQTIDGQPTKVVGAKQTVICAASSGNWIAVSGGGSLGLLRVTTYTASATWVKPSDFRAIYVEVKGGGGPGGSGAAGASNASSGEGGQGGGEGKEDAIFEASPAGSYVVTVGGNAQSSSFGALVSATPGASGRNGSMKTISNVTTLAGGHGATGSGSGGTGGLGATVSTAATIGGAGSPGTGGGGGGGGGGGSGSYLSGAAGGAGGTGFVRVFEFG